MSSRTTSGRISDRGALRRFYLRNAGGILLTSEIWTGIMYWLYLLWNTPEAYEKPFPELFFGMVKTLLFVDQVTFGSLWYIPMILALYLVIPILAAAVETYSLRVFVLPSLVVFLAAMVIPNINSVLTLAGSPYQIRFAFRASNLYSVYVLYLLGGYFVSCGGLKRPRTEIAAVLCVLLFAACFSVQLWAYSRPEEYLVDYDFCLLLPLGVLLFELIRRIGSAVSGEGFFARLVRSLAECSFGVYFLHILIMTLQNRCQRIFADWARSAVVLYLLAVSLLGSWLLVALLSRIRPLRRALFLMK